MESRLNVTIIIPTINEPTLEQVVQAAKREIPEAEIIIVGYGQSETVAKDNSVAFLDLKQKTPKPVGINLAVHIVKNPWLIVVDSDTIPQSGWGKAMLSNFQQGRQVFCGSVMITYGNFWTKVYNLSSFHEFLPENKQEERKHLPACNLGFTKEIYDSCGAWNETLVRSEDYEWTLRVSSMGHKLWFDPRPRILHVPMQQDSFKKVWSSWERSGFYNWIIRKKYRNVLKTPKLFDYPWMVLLFAPILALVPTFRILKTSPSNFFKYIYLIPFVYLTKIAWCWGVFKSSRNSNEHTY